MASNSTTRRPELRELIQRAQGKDRRIRPFLRRERDGLIPEIGTRYVNRKLLMLIVEEAGLTNEFGRPLTSETAAASWKEVLAEPASMPRDALYGRGKRAPDVHPPVAQPSRTDRVPRASPSDTQTRTAPEASVVRSEELDESGSITGVENGQVSQGLHRLEQLRREGANMAWPLPKVLKRRRM